MKNIENTVTKLDNVIKVFGVRSSKIGQIVGAISAIVSENIAKGSQQVVTSMNTVDDIN
ncbi:hypothetical protein [Clostridium thailandense]|uniref:hypothetical protein n=1 Tax=Clostridium thailandense TaxID=2794346 RepID=UPI003989071A